MKVDAIQTVGPKSPVAASKFESYDEVVQECFARNAAKRNMTPQEYVDYLHNPNREPLTIKEFIAGLDKSRMGSFTQEELFEILDEVRGGG